MSEKTDLTRALDAIQARRSVRQYDPERTVSEEAMHTILDCAMCTPTAVNSREWHFVVVRDATRRAKLAGAVPYCKFAAEPTAVCVVVCAELAKEKAPGHWPQDCAAAVQTMLLAAASQGIGSTWTSILPFEDRAKNVGQVIGVPEGVAPFALVVFGYPPQDKPLVVRPSRFDASLVHNEAW